MAPETDFNLETTQTPISVSDVLSSSEGEASISTSISEIYSAIDTENKVKKVDEKVQEQYSNLLSKTFSSSEEGREKQLKNFSEARDKLSVTTMTRSKRSTSLAPILSQEERSSIKKMYNLYHGLKDASQLLSLELQRIAPTDFDIPIALPQTGNKGTAKNINHLLETIRWEDPAIRTQKNRGRTSFYKPDSWGPWSNNPYKPFYGSENEFKEDIKALQANASSAYQQQQQLSRQRAHVMSRFRDQKLLSVLEKQYNEREQAIASLQASKDAHIVQKVAYYLLKSMGQAK